MKNKFFIFIISFMLIAIFSTIPVNAAVPVNATVPDNITLKTVTEDVVYIQYPSINSKIFVKLDIYNAKGKKLAIVKGSDRIISIYCNGSFSVKRYVIKTGIYGDGTPQFVDEQKPVLDDTSGLYILSYSSDKILNADSSEGVTGNFNIQNEDGSVFFKAQTPTERLKEAIHQSLGQMMETMGSAMMILILCGVGCLTLLISLNLFGKVFYLFLN